jgi:cell division protein ZapE
MANDAAAAPTPSARYAQGVRLGRWQDDPAQRAALAALDRVHAEFAAAPAWWKSIQMRIAPRPVRGVYLWGAVGRGKTFLTDLLLESLPATPTLRLHFHRFLGRVHAELAELRGRADPLRDVARHFARQARLFCLDEFFVSDIGDAMILGGLLEHLFARGVTLVTTSNLAPARLYHDGLQRAKFLPAIALIERHCEVVELAAAEDYRLRALTASGVYFTPLGEAAERALAACFERLAPGLRRTEPAIRVNGRDIALKRRADAVAWFDFAALCEGPRAAADYLELAQTFNTVLISGVPRFTAQHDDAARRFVHLVDAFYDHGVHLLLSAAAPPHALYAGERLRGEFARTASRLVEMQGAAYLTAAHRP